MQDIHLLKYSVEAESIPNIENDAGTEELMLNTQLSKDFVSSYIIYYSARSIWTKYQHTK